MHSFWLIKLHFFSEFAWDNLGDRLARRRGSIESFNLKPKSLTTACCNLVEAEKVFSLKDLQSKSARSLREFTFQTFRRSSKVQTQFKLGACMLLNWKTFSDSRKRGK